MNPIIQVEHFSKKYGDFTAVDDISFTIDKGSIFAFLGPNGAGKSTTINTLCTILDKTEGTLTINGHDVCEERRLVRKDIGIVFQDSTLDAQMTVEENLKYHCNFYKVPKNEVQDRINFALDLVGLTQWKRAAVGKSVRRYEAAGRDRERAGARSQNLILGRTHHRSGSADQG